MDGGCSRKYGYLAARGLLELMCLYGTMGGIGGWYEARRIFSGGVEREIRYQLSGIGSRPCDAWGSSQVTWRA